MGLLRLHGLLVLGEDSSKATLLSKSDLVSAISVSLSFKRNLLKITNFKRMSYQALDQ